MGNEEESKNFAELKTESKSTPIITLPPNDEFLAKAKSENQNTILDKAKPRPVNDDAALEMVVTEKRLALIKAWEESEKTKADNKAYKKLSAIGAWETTKTAAVEAELKQIEEKIENEKAKKREKMKNKMAMIHKHAEEKRALTEAKRGEDILKVEDEASKFHATGTLPARLFSCFRY